VTPAHSAGSQGYKQRLNEVSAEMPERNPYSDLVPAFLIVLITLKQFQLVASSAAEMKKGRPLLSGPFIFRMTR
jgi:hypothetical protein